MQPDIHAIAFYIKVKSERNYEVPFCSCICFMQGFLLVVYEKCLRRELPEMIMKLCLCIPGLATLAAGYCYRSFLCMFMLHKPFGPAADF